MSDKENEELDEWKKIRKTLEPTYVYSGNWEEAINLFDKRLKRKFLDPIQLIIDKQELKGEGFTIVTVQCALIETLAAFRKGRIFRLGNELLPPEMKYKESGKIFTSFLRSAGAFENNFWSLNKKGKKSIDVPFSAKDFYVFVRCGLMHEARTKKNWQITATETRENIATEKQFLKEDNGRVKIDRTVLHYRLIHYLEEYKQELRAQTDESKILRKYFARKMDHLFDFSRDVTFDWWVV